MTIGERIRHLRSLAGLSAADVARAARLKSPSHVAAIERGERGRELAASTAVALARALGCTVEYLCSGAGPEPSPEDVLRAFRALEPQGDARAAEVVIEREGFDQTADGAP